MLKSIFPEVNSYLETDRARHLIRKSGLGEQEVLFNLNEVWRQGKVNLNQVDIFDVSMVATQLLESELLQKNNRGTGLWI